MAHLEKSLCCQNWAKRQPSPKGTNCPGLLPPAPAPEQNHASQDRQTEPPRGPRLTSLGSSQSLPGDVPCPATCQRPCSGTPLGVGNLLWSVLGSSGPEPACLGPRGSTLSGGMAWAAPLHLWNRLLEGSISQITVVCCIPNTGPSPIAPGKDDSQTRMWSQILFLPETLSMSASCSTLLWFVSMVSGKALAGVTAQPGRRPEDPRLWENKQIGQGCGRVKGAGRASELHVAA